MEGGGEGVGDSGGLVGEVGSEGEICEMGQVGDGGWNCGVCVVRDDVGDFGQEVELELCDEEDVCCVVGFVDDVLWF